MSEETATDTAAKDEAKELPAANSWFDGDRLNISLDLGKLPRGYARGILLDMDDVLRKWYADREKAKQTIVKPSFFQRTKAILTK